MRKRLMTAVLSGGLLFGTVAPIHASSYHHRSPQQYYKHKRHMKTAKRIGIGAGGGAAVGALAGGGKGAGIGALVGGGAGALYDRHKKHQGKY
jgi:YmgG-like glycine-zipper protein